MLKKVLIPLSLRESKDVLKDMCFFLKSLGTESTVLLHAGTASHGNTGKMDEYADIPASLNIRTESIIRPRTAQIEILEAVKEFDADCISFLFRKKNLLKHIIFGNKVKDIIRQSNIPVFVFRKKLLPEESSRGLKILYPASLEYMDDMIISHIKKMNLRLTEVILMHSGSRAPDPVAEQKRRDRTEEMLEKIRQHCRLEENESRLLSVLGPARKQIVRAAGKYQADLIVLGKADHTGSAEPVFGSTAEHVSYNAPCSVLIIPRNTEKAFNSRGI